MNISKKLLVGSLIINLFLIAISVACMFVTKFNLTVLYLNVAIIVLVFISSVMTWHFGKQFRK